LRVTLFMENGNDRQWTPMDRLLADGFVYSGGGGGGGERENLLFAIASQLSIDR